VAPTKSVFCGFTLPHGENMKELTELGLQLFSEIRNPERAAAMRQAIEENTFGSTLSNLAVDFVFASVWNRDGLERKQRSLVTIGILIALRQTAELKNHIEVGIQNGLTVREVEEAILQAAAYAGFPAAWSAHQAARKVLHHLGLISSSKLPDV
jgi:4-carboxymuconolactone decarboxylase